MTEKQKEKFRNFIKTVKQGEGPDTNNNTEVSKLVRVFNQQCPKTFKHAMSDSGSSVVVESILGKEDPRHRSTHELPHRVGEMYAPSNPSHKRKWSTIEVDASRYSMEKETMASVNTLVKEYTRRDSFSKRQLARFR